VAASPLDDVRNSVDALQRGLWFAVPAITVAMGALAWVVTGRALRPVEAISRRAEEISVTNLHERVPEPSTDDEVAHLARTVNAMLARLDAGADRQRRFVSNASHELRSPVSAIRTQVEVGLRDPATNWDAVGRTVLGESERLERLIDDLLALARTDEAVAAAPAARRTIVPCDLRDAVTTEAGRRRALPIDVEWAADDSVWVAAPGPDVERVLRHLLDNATRHARTSVRLCIRTDGAGVTLLVDDDGPGIAPADRERVLERFTRLDEGRARDEGGSGLGLAVVGEVVRTSGGTVSVEESPRGGARLRVTFPLALAR
jgi:signal transduction histidine kinase